MRVLPEAYQVIYDEFVCNIMPEAERLMMIADEMIAEPGNLVILTNNKVHITIRCSTKVEAKEYLESINDSE